MAYPGDPVAKGPARFEHAPLTPDDLEQLATAFRPSWELDEAPFTGAGTLSAADVQALQGGGTHADVRAAMPNAGSAFAPPRPNSVEALGSVVVEESIIVRDPPAPAPALRPAPPPAPPPRVPAADAAPAVALEATRIVPRRPAAAQSARVESFEAEVSPFARPSRKPLWLGLGAGVVVLAGLGIWAASGGQADPPATSAPAATATHAPQMIPLPTLVAPAPMAPAVTATAIAVTTPSALPRAPATATVAVAPTPSPAPLPPRYVTAAPPPHPVAAPQPAPKPAPHPKGGTTIVHDVPF
jgi:hypothetical protein